MELARINVDRNLYGDKQSRLIQRINKFKTTANSLLMRPDAHYFDKEADKDEYFRNTNDKTLIEHRKRKQLQTINKYKEQHKSEYMEKLFDQALQKFSLQDVQLGCPKYLVFYFQKEKSQHERVYIKTTLNISGNLTNEEDIRKQVEVKLVDKKLAQILIEKGLVKLKQNATTDIEILSMDANSTAIDIYDNRVALILKVMVYPTLKMEEILSTSENKVRFDVCLRIDSQNGQILSEQVFKLKPTPLNCEYELTFHNYEYEQEEISIPLNIQSCQKDHQMQSLTSSIQVIASADIEYRVSNSKDRLDIKVKYPKITQSIDHQTIKDIRQVQITLLDNGLNFLLAAYKIRLFTYHKMKQISKYSIGQICKYCFDLPIDQEIYSQLSNMQKSSTQKSISTLVGFYSSHMNQCAVYCNGKSELVIQDNQSYKMEVNYQSFSMDSNEDRVIIHMMDLNSNVILKKWLLKTQKTFDDYRSINQIKVHRNKVLKYKYLLKNRLGKQRSFKFFTSNYSIISVPQHPVILNENQQTNVQLSMVVRKQDLSAQERQKGIAVIVRIEESQTQSGWNQLFRLQLD